MIDSAKFYASFDDLNFFSLLNASFAFSKHSDKFPLNLAIALYSIRVLISFSIDLNYSSGLVSSFGLFKFI